MERKSYAVSDQTKQQLAAALRERMAHKPLDKITVSELTEACGIRRQTFYYHFEDICDLLRWMLESDAAALLRQHAGAVLWQDGLLQLFAYLQDNRAVCRCALHSTGRDHLHRFLESDVYAVIYRTIEQMAETVLEDKAQAHRQDVALLTHFYVISTVAVLESWLNGELDRTPEQLVDFAETMLDAHARGLKEQIQEKGQCL